MEVVILDSGSPTILADQINAYLKKGWKLRGYMRVTGAGYQAFGYSQMMIRKE